MNIFLFNLNPIEPHFLDVVERDWMDDLIVPSGFKNWREGFSNIHWNRWGWLCSIQFWIFEHDPLIFIQYYWLPLLTLGLKRVGRVKFLTRVPNSTCPTRLICPPIAKLSWQPWAISETNYERCLLIISKLRNVHNVQRVAMAPVGNIEKCLKNDEGKKRPN